MRGLQPLGFSFSREWTSMSHRAGEGWLPLSGMDLSPSWDFLGFFGAQMPGFSFVFFSVALAESVTAPLFTFHLSKLLCEASAICVCLLFVVFLGLYLVNLFLSQYKILTCGPEAQWIVTNQGWVQLIFFFGVLRTLAFLSTDNGLRESQFSVVRSYAQQRAHHLFLHYGKPYKKQILPGFVLSPKINLPAWFHNHIYESVLKMKRATLKSMGTLRKAAFVYFFCSWALAGRKRQTSPGVCVFRCTSQR